MTEGHIILCFLPDGEVRVHTEYIKDRKLIAEKFLKFCKIIVDQPELAYHAVGFCKKVKEN